MNTIISIDWGRYTIAVTFTDYNTAYAHTALSTANLAHIYNYMMTFSVNPMHSVEQHLDVLDRAERACNLK